MLDEKEFLSPSAFELSPAFTRITPTPIGWAIRSIGVVCPRGFGQRHVRRQFELARPIWMPVNMLILRALLQYYLYYGNSFTIECPTGQGGR